MGLVGQANLNIQCQIDKPGFNIPSIWAPLAANHYDRHPVEQIFPEERSPPPAAPAGGPPNSPIAPVSCPAPPYPSPIAVDGSPRSPSAGTVGGPPSHTIPENAVVTAVLPPPQSHQAAVRRLLVTAMFVLNFVQMSKEKKKRLVVLSIGQFQEFNGKRYYSTFI